jgi:hypothetical protein
MEEAKVKICTLIGGEDDRSADLFPIIRWMDICPPSQNQPIDHGDGFVRESRRRKRREIKRKPPCPFHAFRVSQVKEVQAPFAFGAKLQSNGDARFHGKCLKFEVPKMAERKCSSAAVLES